jgi:hypothetical protein
MHAIDLRHVNLARARVHVRWQAVRRAGWATPWAVCSLAALLLALAIGSVAAGPDDGRNDAGGAAPGAVITADAKASGMSVAALVQTSRIPIQPLPGMGAPGRAGSETMPEPGRTP